mmetsp:Transcript_55081/g.131257  ORF Transcript_55081/g.131257 Transcript_55081/m.131257 type:complete len:215 (+) Transcript_55081:133-777(+)|eukprot:CAMPEP_0178404626 /NCGR_PEP_ID=MMETSP0689_2-20121128/17983_1 /TAXON_ID=160604 /ORGANISM="Amphidinium massartii, Strain CS-259" /LENGTH=214 /DNA_ID=CAMNT_0020025621 /DNA_START=121 /DNA_END=765 /DNA_ORIENTATION=-
MSKLLRNATSLDRTGTGAVGQSAMLTGTKIDVLSEEKQLIQQIFDIVDKDHSGSVDAQELLRMFEMFGESTGHLQDALARIMSKADGDMDEQINPQEFYSLLSQRFKPGDSTDEIEKVFGMMSKEKPSDQQLTERDLFEVGKLLGEDVPLSECHDMIKMFNSKYQKELKDYTDKQKRGSTTDVAVRPVSPRMCTRDDFVQVMLEPLEDAEGDVK